MRASSLFLTLVALVLALDPAPRGAFAQTAETAAVITEIKPGRGRVEVKPASGGDWRPAGPLLALRVGDTVRTTENAVAVVLLSGGRGTARVEGASGSFTVPAASTAGQGQKARALVESSLGYLAGTARESSQAALATRSIGRPPVVLGPRNGRALPEGLAFDWLGGRSSRYTVRVVGPGGMVVERRDVTGVRWPYPTDAPPLSPNVRYTVQVIGAGPAQEAWFEVVDAARQRAVAADLESLDQAMGASASPTSRAVLRAGLLAREELLHDARQVVVAALAQDRDEPTLHQLLGDLYRRVGLPDLAAESFDEARHLLTQ
jgi:hypothetical protein